MKRESSVHNNIFLTLTAAALIGLAGAGQAETMKEKGKEAGNDISRASSKSVRKVKDETCELVNGKMECAAKKVKHSIQNSADEVEDKVE